MRRRAVVLSFLVLAPALVGQTPRRPRGVYAKVDVSKDIAAEQQASPSITPAELDAYFNTTYQGLLTDPATSGIQIQFHWDQTNPNPPASLASQKLMEIAEPPDFFIGEASLSGGVYYLQFPNGNLFGWERGRVLVRLC
jgi:hypothetical protein